jgi:hypothetical protein
MTACQGDKGCGFMAREDGFVAHRGQRRVPLRSRIVVFYSSIKNMKVAE